MQTATHFTFTFDFDEWARLARTDVDAFEAKRLALIEDFLCQFSGPGLRRLRGLQFRIDMERRRARTPMAACLRLSAMMWDSLLGQHGLKDAFDAFLAGQTPAACVARSATDAGAAGCRILPFRKPVR